MPAESLTAESARVVVVSSQDTGPYQELIDGFRQYLAEHVVGLLVDVYVVRSEAELRRVLADVSATRARVLLTIGSRLVDAAVRELRDIPIVAGMIVSAEVLPRSANVTGVLLEFPLETQFQWMRRIFPDSAAVGVMFNPSENHAKVIAASRVAESLGLTLVPREVDTPRNLPDALETLSRTVDVLWGLTDEVVMTPQTAESILLAGFRNKIPLAGLSTSWVKAGALYALDRDYTDIGRQCAELAVKVLSGTKPNALPAAYPRTVNYALNLKTARLMNLDIPQDIVRNATTVFE